MNRAEYTQRATAAATRLGKADPVAAILFVCIDIGATAIRAALHCSMAVGVCSVAGWSYWFAPVIAVLSAQTLGRGWEYARRSSRVRALEAAADAAEKAVAK